MSKDLQIDGDNYGLIIDKKTIGGVKIWLTSKPDSTWWIVVDAPDHTTRLVAFVRPPQERRARATYDSLNEPNVLDAFLDGRDS